MSENPYAAPSAALQRPSKNPDEATFIPNGQCAPMMSGARWFADGWSLFRPAAGIWIASFLLFWLIKAFAFFVPLGSLAMTIIGPVFVAGFFLIAKSIEKGEPPSVGTLFQRFSDTPTKLILLGLTSIGFGIIMLVIVVVAALSLFGGMVIGLIQHNITPDDALASISIVHILVLTLIVLTPLFLIATAMMYAPLLIADRDMDILSALTMSFHAINKNWLSWLVFSLVFLVGFIVALIPLGLGLLVFIPLCFCAFYASYRDIYYNHRVEL